MKKQQGFTLIELVVVIIILGILAVTAAPKFIDIQSDARESTLKGLEGALNGANNMVYTKASLVGVQASATSTLDLNNTPSDTDDDVAIAYGYVDATETAIAAIAQLSDDWVFVDTTANDGIIAIAQQGAPNLAIDSDGAGSFTATTEASLCHLVYTKAASATTLPTIEIKADGC